MAMQQIIINEKKYVEDIIQSSTIPKELTANMVIMYLTKYYYYKDKFISLEEITEKVCDHMNEFNYDVYYYQEYKAKHRIKGIYNDLSSGKLSGLRDFDYIPIYKSEYNKVMSCESDKKKKVLFTLYALARFTNRYGWVYISESDIYKLANTTKTKDNLLAYMIQDGLVKCTKKVDDLKVGVELSDTKEDVSFKIYDMNYIGNQLIASIKDGYKMCECCGKLIKTTNNRQKYCEKCYKDLNKFDAKNRMKKYRET